MGCCDVARETPDLTREEDSRINSPMVGKPWVMVELLPSVWATSSAGGRLYMCLLNCLKFMYSFATSILMLLCGGVLVWGSENSVYS